MLLFMSQRSQLVVGDYLEAVFSFNDAMVASMFKVHKYDVARTEILLKGDSEIFGV